MPEIISTSKTDLSYIVEVTAGETPATPTFQSLPIVSGGPVGGKTTAVSETIRTDRQKTDLVTVDQDVTGDINFELQYNAYKPMLVSLMQGTTVSGTETQVDIAVDDVARTFTSAAAADFSTVPAGSYIRTEGFSNAANNGLFRVESATTLVITVSTQDGSNLVAETAGASATIAWGHTPNGTGTPDSYTFKKEVTLATPAYMYYRGCMINAMNMSFTTGQILSGSISILGLTEDVTETEIAGSSTTAIPADALMNSVESLAFSSSGLEADVQVETASLNYDNGITPAKVIGVLGAAALSPFTITATGDLTLYFEDISVYTLFLNGTSFSLSFKFNDQNGNSVVFFLPNCQFTTVEAPVPGRDQFFMINASYEALRDPTLGFTMGMNLIDT